MPRPYSAQSLSIEQVPRALALVQLFDGNITPEWWSECANFYLRPDLETEKRDIISLESPNGYIYGLAFCWLKLDLKGGRTLAVENFMSAELCGIRRAANQLLEAAEQLARTWKCDRICFNLIEPSRTATDATPGRPTTEPFLSSGYTEDRQRFCKTLAPNCA